MREDERRRKVESMLSPCWVWVCLSMSEWCVLHHVFYFLSVRRLALWVPSCDRGAFGGPPPATPPFAHFPAPQAPGPEDVRWVSCSNKARVKRTTFFNRYSSVSREFNLQDPIKIKLLDTFWYSLRMRMRCMMDEIDVGKNYRSDWNPKKNLEGV